MTHKHTLGHLLLEYDIVQRALKAQVFWGTACAIINSAFLLGTASCACLLQPVFRTDAERYGYSESHCAAPFQSSS
jgi:hypothetical protein